MEYLLAQLDGKQLDLIYRMTRDGATLNDFHSRCDNQGPTVTLFKTSSGRSCGGYVSESWDSPPGGCGYWKEDYSAFLISFDAQQRFDVSRPDEAIYCDMGLGPWFGDCLLSAHEPFNEESKCLSLARMRDQYEIADEDNESLLTGEDYFTAEEIEVFRVV